MIFYGTKGSIIKNGQVRNIICPHCNESATFNFSVYGRCMKPLNSISAKT